MGRLKTRSKSETSNSDTESEKKENTKELVIRDKERKAKMREIERRRDKERMEGEKEFTIHNDMKLFKERILNWLPTRDEKVKEFLFDLIDTGREMI